MFHDGRAPAEGRRREEQRGAYPGRPVPGDRQRCQDDEEDQEGDLEPEAAEAGATLDARCATAGRIGARPGSGAVAGRRRRLLRLALADRRLGREPLSERRDRVFELDGDPSKLRLNRGEKYQNAYRWQLSLAV